MKYIIEFEDEPCEYEGGRLFYTCKQIPYWSVDKSKINKLPPYTEPDRKTINLRHARDIEKVAKMNYNEGVKDAWEFAKTVSIMKPEDKRECWGTDKYNTINLGYSYQEAKAKYDAWSKQNICEGDEVMYNSRTRAVVLKPETKEKYGTILTSEFVTIAVSHDDLEKTGRCFPEVVELLKKMRDSDD